jgi:16S rRNA G1207 methylase RsmC
MDDDHYFSADPAVAFKRVAVTTTVWGHRLSMTSGSGVFAQGRLDTGTSVLFRETEPPPPGTFLDLGCGYGVISCALAVSVPTARVWAIDVNERAVLLTGENAAKLRVSARLTAVTPNAVPVDVGFDEIWSNPPIRIGKQALHELLSTWMSRLNAGGRTVMVVGKNLGADSLQRWLTDQGYPTERLASAKGFRVLESRPAT